jgi:hypothetical protein
VKIRLRDGSLLRVDDNLPEDQIRVIVNQAESQLTADPNLSRDPAETDDWGTYIDKQVKSSVRGGAGGLASTVDFLANTIGVAPRVGYNLVTGEAPLKGFGTTDVRDAYERNVIPQPRGSDYETNARISEVVAPAVVETLATGSPKTAPLRALRDVGLGVAGGEAGEFVGDLYSPQAGDLGRLIGGAVSPLGVSRTGAKLASMGSGLGLATRLTGLPNPLNYVPKMSWPGMVGAVIGGGGASQAYDYGEDQRRAEERRRLDEQNRLMMEGP